MYFIFACLVCVLYLSFHISYSLLQTTIFFLLLFLHLHLPPVLLFFSSFLILLHIFLPCFSLPFSYNPAYPPPRPTSPPFLCLCLLPFSLFFSSTYFFFFLLFVAVGEGLNLWVVRPNRLLVVSSKRVEL